MAKILVVDGHPDPHSERFVHALARAYAEAAGAAGHEVRVVTLAGLDYPLLRANEDFLKGEPPAVVRGWQQDLAWCNHLAIVFPLWLGSMPALLKGFFEQTLRPGFAFGEGGRGFPKKLLAGRSARIIVTMGMPAFFYRWYFRAHSLKSLERNVLAFVGVKPVRASIIGNVEGLGAAGRQRWLDRVRALAREGR